MRLILEAQPQICSSIISTSTITDNIERVRRMIADDRRQYLRIIAEELKINKDNEHSGKWQICARFVPQMLTNQQKQTRVETSGDLIDMCDRNSQFLETIITGYETWCYQYGAETKRQSTAWCSLSSVPPKKVGWQNPRLRRCWSPFSTARARSIMNFYPRVKVSTRKLTRDFWNGCCNTSDGFGQNCTRVDSGISSTTTPVRTLLNFLVQRKITVFPHPPYSPDLAPADFFLFPRLKLVLKGLRFTYVADIK